MLGTATDPSKRTVSKGLLCLRLLLLGLLAALVLASSAAADSGETIESPAVTEEQAAPPPEETQVAAESTPEGGETVTPPTEEAVAEVPPAPVEETVQVTLPPPVEETTQVITGVEEAAEQPIKQVTEAVQQQVGGTGGEESSRGNTTSSSSTVMPAPNTESAPGEVAGTAASSTSTNSMTPLAVESSGPSDPGEPPAAAGARGSERGGLGCQASVLGNSLSQGCAASWLGASNLAPSVTAVIEGTSTSIVGAVVAASAAIGNGSDNDSPAIGNRPVAPASGGSAPSGAAGGVGAGSPGGLGLSAFLTIAGMLLLAAPHAMRRLRLSCLPWRTAFFVLIPERPG